MQGNWNHDKPHYRCRFPAEYAVANKIDHPPTVYLREDAVVPSLDAWLARAFGADQINRTLAAMEASQPDTSVETSQLRRTVADCDRRLVRHRAALEAGADRTLVAQWTRDVQPSGRLRWRGCRRTLAWHTDSAGGRSGS